MGYYLFPITIPLLVLGLFLALSPELRKRCAALALHTINVSMLVIFIYFLVLGFYFQHYYLGPDFEKYPSLIISEWWGLAMVVVVIPLNIAYALFLLWKKFSR